MAADPTWLQESVSAYYPHVEKIVVSYDEESRGWTGAAVPVESCLEKLRMIDRDGKLEFRPGRFGSARSGDPHAADTHQRRTALAQAAEGAEWVLQIDTDEILPRWQALRNALEQADNLGIGAVEWPMRVLYRRLRDGRFLEVVTANGSNHFEYPGPIAVRPDVNLVDCRRTDGPFLRPVVLGDHSSLQVADAAGANEHRLECLESGDAIWHNSWGRSSAVVRRKIRSWSHNDGLGSWLYYYIRWWPAPVTWRSMRNFNPVHPPLWPRLRIVSAPPFEL